MRTIITFVWLSAVALCATAQSTISGKVGTGYGDSFDVRICHVIPHKTCGDKGTDVMDTKGRLIARTDTINGEFTFHDVPAGCYIVAAFRSDFQYPNPIQRRVTAPVQEEVILEFPVHGPVWRDRDTPYGEIKGTVTDSDNVPVCRLVKVQFRSRDVYREVETDINSNYRSLALPAGIYVVRAENPETKNLSEPKNVSVALPGAPPTDSTNIILR